MDDFDDTAASFTDEPITAGQGLILGALVLFSAASVVALILFGIRYA